MLYLPLIRVHQSIQETCNVGALREHDFILARAWESGCLVGYVDEEFSVFEINLHFGISVIAREMPIGDDGVLKFRLRKDGRVASFEVG